MRKHGHITRWDAARGFGFIRSPQSQAEVFFHVKDFSGGQPLQGSTVSFEEIHVGGKGPRAMAVQAREPVATPRPMPRTARPQRDSRAPARRRNAGPGDSPAAAPGAFMLLLITAYAGLLAWGIWTAQLPGWIAAASLALNLLTFLVYAFDKHAAQTGGWRTREDTLHALALAGGWPGACFAQQLLRHKSNKADFRAVYATTVFLHVAGLCAWLFRDRLMLLAR